MTLPEPFEAIEDRGGYKRFVITVTELDKHAIGITVNEITSWEVDSHKRLYTDPYLKCWIKWDSCSHFWFGEEDQRAYFHFCGAESYILHIKLMKFLYEYAFKAMGREPCDEDDAIDNVLQA